MKRLSIVFALAFLCIGGPALAQEPKEPISRDDASERFLKAANLYEEGKYQESNNWFINAVSPC